MNLLDQPVAEARATFATRVRALRQRSGLSQQAAAERAGVDQGQWSRFESANANPTLSSLLRIRHALDLPSIELLLGSFPSASVTPGRQEVSR